MESKNTIYHDACDLEGEPELGRNTLIIICMQQSNPFFKVSVKFIKRGARKRHLFMNTSKSRHM